MEQKEFINLWYLLIYAWVKAFCDKLVLAWCGGTVGYVRFLLSWYLRLNLTRYLGSSLWFVFDVKVSTTSFLGLLWIWNMVSRRSSWHVLQFFSCEEVHSLCSVGHLTVLRVSACKSWWSFLTFFQVSSFSVSVL